MILLFLIISTNCKEWIRKSVLQSVLLALLLFFLFLLLLIKKSIIFTFFQTSTNLYICMLTLSLHEDFPQNKFYQLILPNQSPILWTGKSSCSSNLWCISMTKQTSLQQKIKDKRCINKKTRKTKYWISLVLREVVQVYS